MLSARLLNDGTLEITATGCICEYEAPEEPYEMPEDQFSAADFRSALGWYPADQKKFIKLYLNSTGGSINQGIETMNLLAMEKVPKTCVITALAASAATLLPLACDEVIMLPGSMQFLHMPITEAEGNSSDLRSEADRLDARAKQLAGLFAKTGKSVDEMLALMAANTWLTAEECVNLKLATSAPALGAKDAAKLKVKGDRMKLPGMSDTMRAKLDPLSFVFDTLGVSDLDTLKAFKSEFDTLKADTDSLTVKVNGLLTEKAAISAERDTALASFATLKEKAELDAKNHADELDTLKASVDKSVSDKLAAQLPLAVAKVITEAGLPQPIKIETMQGKIPESFGLDRTVNAFKKKK